MKDTYKATLAMLIGLTAGAAVWYLTCCSKRKKNCCGFTAKSFKGLGDSLGSKATGAINEMSKQASNIAKQVKSKMKPI